MFSLFSVFINLPELFSQIFTFPSRSAEAMYFSDRPIVTAWSWLLLAAGIISSGCWDKPAIAGKENSKKVKKRRIVYIKGRFGHQIYIIKNRQKSQWIFLKLLQLAGDSMFSVNC